MPKQSPAKKKVVIGLTGTFGCGKSTVAKIFKSHGATVIDADRLAHRVLRTDKEVYRKAVKAFGKSILSKDKNINRKKLGTIVFRKANYLKKLNKIIHPRVIKVIKEKLRKSANGLIVLDAPLLIEAGLENIVDKLVVVGCQRQAQIQRIQRKTLLCKKDILKRIKQQATFRMKKTYADFVIDNSGSVEETKKQVERIRRLLWKN
ncbi:MAG: dephospho-CoA kinase [Candidatus Omnitrophota bacterium]